MKEKASQTGCGMQTAELPSRSSTEQESTSDCSFSRRCNGIMGVPITFLDKYNPDEFEIIQLCASHGKVPKGIENESGYINGKWLYARILIQKKKECKY